MGTGGERLHEVLEGYDRFLIEKDLSSQKERPYLVRWVRYCCACFPGLRLARSSRRLHPGLD